MLTGINHITFAVDDVERSFDFYTKVLGLKPIAKWKTGAYLTAGGTWIALNQDSDVLNSRKTDYSHIAFSCDLPDFEILKSRLLEYGCREWSENESEGESFYFLDPDGHQLEIHVGSLDSRIAAMQISPSHDFKFYA